MPKTACVPCLHPDVKDYLKKNFSSNSILALIDKLVDCPDNIGINLCDDRKSRQGRTPSAYNLFVSSCMKEKKGTGMNRPAMMKECAVEWRRKKG